MTLKIALIECYPERAEIIKKLIKKTNSNSKVDIFPIYKNNFPKEIYDGYIYSGGSISITKKEKFDYLIKLEKLTQKIYDNNKPLLGICLGFQIIVDTFGGVVKKAKKLEVSFKKITLSNRNKIVKGIKKEFYAFNYHEDHIIKLPKEFENFASSDMCKIHLIKHITKPIYGIQFHPEYDDKSTKRILTILRNNIESEGYNLEELIKKTRHYSKEVSMKIMTNFLDIINKNKIKNINLSKK